MVPVAVPANDGADRGRRPGWREGLVLPCTPPCTPPSKALLRLGFAVSPQPRPQPEPQPIAQPPTDFRPTFASLKPSLQNPLPDWVSRANRQGGGKADETFPETSDETVPVPP